MSYPYTIPGSPMSLWDGTPIDHHVDRPTVHLSRDGNFRRYNQYIIDGLDAAEYNVSEVEDGCDLHMLLDAEEAKFTDKEELRKELERLGLPFLRQYPMDSNITKVTHPVILKTKSGKGGADKFVLNAYKIFPNGSALWNAVGNESSIITPEQFLQSYIVEEAVYEPGFVVNKVLAFVMIDPNSVCRVIRVDEQKFTQRFRGTVMDEGIGRPTTIHNQAILDIAKPIVDNSILRSCFLYMQCIVHDGVYYFNDADVCVPRVYAGPLNKYLPQHIKFIYGEVPFEDVTIPTEYTVARVITSMKGDYTTHLNLLESSHAAYGAHYWIQRFDSNPTVVVGKYLLFTSGDTEQEAMDKMNAYVNFLTK